MVSVLLQVWRSKTLLVMRLTLFICFFFALQSIATESFSQNQRKSINKKEMKISDVLQLIESKTDYSFMYSAKTVDVERTVDLDVTNKLVSEILDHIFKNSNVSYKINGRLIALSNNDVPSPANQQKKTVSGKVSDTGGNSLPGVSVVVKGTSVGTITDVEGNYKLSNLSPDAILLFSFVGMKTLEVKVSEKNILDVTLQEEAVGLDEVVAVGYGTQKKVNLTGSISSINSGIIENRPIKSAVDAMQGTIAGLTVQSSNGQPGTFSTFKIRGQTSINSGGALVIVDGIPGNLNQLNPQDIESISVLKDAASAAIYGARAAEGVILVTTKQAQSDKISIDYSGDYAYKIPTRLPKPTTGLRFMEMANEAARAVNAADPFPKSALDAYAQGIVSIPNGSAWIFTANTDWVKMLMKNSSQQSHNLTLSKSSGNGLKYLFSTGWMGQDGLFSKYGPDSYNQYSFRSNVSCDIIKDVLKFDSRISFLRSAQDYLPTAWAGWTIPYVIFVQMGPTMPVYDANGHYSRYRKQSNAMQLLQQSGTGYNKKNKLDAAFTLDFYPIKGLKLSALGGATLSNVSIMEFNRTCERWGPLGLLDNPPVVGQGGVSNVTVSKDNNNYLTGQFTATYKKEIKGHEFSILGGVSYEDNKYDYLQGYRTNIIANLLPALDLGTAGITNTASPSYEWALFSTYARLNYSYKSKYLFEANFRADASSRFSNKHRWGMFPSFSAGWRVSEENFMKSQNVISNLKIRSSWGQTGNQNGLGYYDYIAQYAVGGYYPFVNEPQAQWVLSSGLPSADRTWETVEVLNEGIDISFLNNRLNLTGDYFIKTNKNMLMSVAVPSVIGIGVPTGNFGKLKTKGWEVSVVWKDKIKKVDYTVGVNLSDQLDELVTYANKTIAATGAGTNYTQGYAMGAMFGYKTDGYFQTAAEAANYPHIGNNPAITAGDIKYLDISGATGTPDGKIDQFDLTYIGNSAPRYVFGVNLGATWKGFDVSALIQGVAKRDYYIGSEAVSPFLYPFGNTAYTYQEDYWTTSNPNAFLPRNSNNTSWNYQSSDHWIQNAAYVRLKNLQVGYTIDPKISKKAYISKCRIYFSGDNVWEYSKLLKAYDPELNVAGGYMYPIMRSFSLGLNLSF